MFHSAPVVHETGGMQTERIDFISAYCDRWCERCAFTDRCSSFAVHIAQGMCDGDIAAAIELAIGAPQSVDGDPPPTPGERLLNELGDFTISDQEMEEHRKAEQARRKRLDATTVAKMADVYSTR